MIDRAKRTAHLERFDAGKREIAAEDRHDHFGRQFVRVIARRLRRFGYAETAETELVCFYRCVVGFLGTMLVRDAEGDAAAWNREQRAAKRRQVVLLGIVVVLAETRAHIVAGRIADRADAERIDRCAAR